MTTHAARLNQAWQDGDTLDITPAMMRVTLAIAAQTLLDADVEAEASAIGQAITTLVQGSAEAPALGPLVRRLPYRASAAACSALRYLDTLIYQLIDARRVQEVRRGCAHDVARRPNRGRLSPQSATDP